MKTRMRRSNNSPNTAKRIQKRIGAAQADARMQEQDGPPLPRPRGFEAGSCADVLELGRKRFGWHEYPPAEMRRD